MVSFDTASLVGRPCQYILFRSRPIPPSSGRQKAADHFWAKKNSKNVAPSPKRPADLVLALSAASAPERTMSGLDVYATGGSFTVPSDSNLNVLPASVFSLTTPKRKTANPRIIQGFFDPMGGSGVFADNLKAHSTSPQSSKTCTHSSDFFSSINFAASSEYSSLD